MEKKVLIGIILTTIIGFGVWVFWETKPKPGQQLEDLGRNHVPIGTEVQYNSNPPTSGPHYEDWIRAGVYDAPREDKNLVHSLEHGYVIISYNCTHNPTSSLVKSAFAQGMTGQMSLATDSASPSATLSPEFNSEACKQLVTQLTEVYEGKGKRKLIVIPRPNLDSKLALTAWRHLDKFNDFDKERIEKFIDGHRDKGPEKTME